MVSRHDSGALLAKFDINAAYHNVAIHPSDRFLLGMKWRVQFYIDLALPFRLCSALFIFDSVVSLVECKLLHNYNVFYYGGSSRLTQCVLNLQSANLLCQKLGLPLQPDKCVGPATYLVVLDIELDSVNQITRLPAVKLQDLQELITSWIFLRWCNRQQLKSLVGHLHHAAKVVWLGQAFIRCMIDLLSGPSYKAQ